MFATSPLNKSKLANIRCSEKTSQVFRNSYIITSKDSLGERMKHSNVMSSTQMFKQPSQYSSKFARDSHTTKSTVMTRTSAKNFFIMKSKYPKAKVPKFLFYDTTAKRRKIKY